MSFDLRNWRIFPKDSPNLIHPSPRRTIIQIVRVDEEPPALEMRLKNWSFLPLQATPDAFESSGRKEEPISPPRHHHHQRPQFVIRGQVAAARGDFMRMVMMPINNNKADGRRRRSKGKFNFQYPPKTEAIMDAHTVGVG